MLFIEDNKLTFKSTKITILKNTIKQSLNTVTDPGYDLKGKGGGVDFIDGGGVCGKSLKVLKVVEANVIFSVFLPYFY